MEKANFDPDKINHIDMANQIDNPWERDTILSFLNKSKKINYSIRFKNSDKLRIRKKFIDLSETQSAKKHNRKVINLIFAYLIIKILIAKKELIDSIFICPDHRPSKEVHHYIQKLSYYFGNPRITQEIDINFINRKKYEIKKRTPAHSLAKKILKGKKEANENADIRELEEITPKLL